MKIVSASVEPGRGSRACVEFAIRVTLSGEATGCEAVGRVVGPRAEGVTTVEAAYPLTATGTSDNAVSLKCVIPEPCLWTRDAPFAYAWWVAVRVGGVQTDSRAGSVAFPAPT